ncbi:MAG TPA: HhH-GPD-type base excision DNA repair protein [Candidatus Limnocylindrales bacterium]|nr:HhH-GPD-type base excision DNA repair protein [Candidatus Limnocylindrales bacterium]
MATTIPESLPFTGDPEADALIARDPLALLIGFTLDQQVPVQKAFSGPLELRRRLGHLDCAKIAAIDPAELAEIFQRRPALHRFPGAMAGRVQVLCATITSQYDGDASRIWGEAKDGRDLERRLLALPGVGDMKAKTLIAVLGKRFGVRPPGWEDVAPKHPTLGDVDSAEALAHYQAGKRAKKAALRAEAGRGGKSRSR